MSVRLAQATALQPLQALDVSIVQPLQLWSRQLLARSGSFSAKAAKFSSFSQQPSVEQQMTMQQMRDMNRGSSAAVDISDIRSLGRCAANPSPSSSTSDCFHMDRYGCRVRNVVE